MTPRRPVSESILHCLMVALRAEGWQITPPRITKEKRLPQFWKDADIEFVRVAWPDPAISTEDICARVGRTLEAVKHKAAAIGVRRPVGRPAKKEAKNPTLRKSAEILAETVMECLETSPKILRETYPTIADATEIVSTRVPAHDHAPKMPDRDPIPAPRRGKRGGVDRTGALMGDPGHANRREAEADYSKGGSALS